MKDINGRKITLEALKEQLRQKSRSELLEEMEVVLARRFADPDLVFAYSDIINEKDPVAPPFDSAASRERLHACISLAKAKPGQEALSVHSKLGHPFWRVLRTVPGLVVLILALVMLGQASGVLQFLDYGDGTFSISANSGLMELPSDIEAEFHTLQEALDYYGVDGPVSVQWIPNDFSLESVKAYPVDGLTMISAQYTAKGDRIINIRVFEGQMFLGRNEWDDGEKPIEYKQGDTMFYLTNNFDQRMAFWEVGAYECRMGGDITEKELKAMIQSIFRE